MVTQTLLDYIKQQLAVGVSKEDLQKALVAGGWAQADVTAAFAVLLSPTPAPTAKPQQPQTPPAVPAIVPGDPAKPVSQIGPTTTTSPVSITPANVQPPAAPLAPKVSIAPTAQPIQQTQPAQPVQSAQQPVVTITPLTRPQYNPPSYHAQAQITPEKTSSHWFGILLTILFLLLILGGAAAVFTVPSIRDPLFAMIFPSPAPEVIAPPEVPITQPTTTTTTTATTTTTQPISTATTQSFPIPWVIYVRTNETATSTKGLLSVSVASLVTGSSTSDTVNLVLKSASQTKSASLAKLQTGTIGAYRVTYTGTVNGLSSFTVDGLRQSPAAIKALKIPGTLTLMPGDWAEGVYNGRTIVVALVANQNGNPSLLMIDKSFSSSVVGPGTSSTVSASDYTLAEQGNTDGSEALIFATK